MAVLDKIATKRIVRNSGEHGDYETWYDYQGVSIKYEEGLDRVFKKPYVVLSCPDKRLESIRVEKSKGGDAMFTIDFGKGRTPKDLMGRFTELNTAIIAVMKYLKSAPKSAKKEVKDKWAARHEETEQS